MDDLRLQYSEDIVGAGHPVLPDSANRLFLGGSSPTLRNEEGKSLVEVYVEQEAAPETAAGELAVYSLRDAGGTLRLYVRREDSGESVELGAPETVDQGEAAVTWSTNVATVALGATLSDLGAHMLRLNTGGAGLAANGFYAWLETDQIQLRTVDGAAGVDGTLAWEVVRMPAGRVQRGHTDVTATTGGTTTDIALASPIDLARAFVSLLHVGRYLGRQTDYFSGRLIKHASDASKLQAVMASASGTQVAPLSWECWSP